MSGKNKHQELFKKMESEFRQKFGQIGYAYSQGRDLGIRRTDGQSLTVNQIFWLEPYRREFISAQVD